MPIVSQVGIRGLPARGVAAAPRGVLGRRRGSSSVRHHRKVGCHLRADVPPRRPYPVSKSGPIALLRITRTR
jgi:hypothetical protein